MCTNRTAHELDFRSNFNDTITISIEELVPISHTTDNIISNNICNEDCSTSRKLSSASTISSPRCNQIYTSDTIGLNVAQHFDIKR